MVTVKGGSAAATYVLIHSVFLLVARSTRSRPQTGKQVQPKDFGPSPLDEKRFRSIGSNFNTTVIFYHLKHHDVSTSRRRTQSCSSSATIGLLSWNWLDVPCEAQTLRCMQRYREGGDCRDERDGHRYFRSWPRSYHLRWCSRGQGGRCTNEMHGRRRMNIDPRISTIPGRGMSRFPWPAANACTKRESPWGVGRVA